MFVIRDIDMETIVQLIGMLSTFFLLFFFEGEFSTNYLEND